MSAFLEFSAASLTFQLSKRMSIFVLNDDELDVYGFIRETFSCYCSFVHGMIL